MKDHKRIKTEILIIGAGAAGLMAARELGKAGKKLIILEARNRIGGRIWPLPEEMFGYQAQSGAEFVHGDAPFTKSLAKEAGMTLILIQGDMWSSEHGEFTINSEPVPNQDVLHKTLKELEHDMPIAEFLKKYFSAEKYARLRNSVTRIVEGYDAADPNRISTFALRNEWLGGQEWLQYRVKEGYGALLAFLESECRKNGTEIRPNTVVKEVETRDGRVTVRTTDGRTYDAEQALVTVSLPLLKDINFIPAIPEKLEAASKMGFGNVIKLLLRFKNAWWVDISGKDFRELDFILSDEIVSVWWTQYPNPVPVLTGWLAGSKAEKFLHSSSEDILEAGLISLANIFNVKKEYLESELVNSKVAHWPADPFSKGAYSYFTPESEEAYAELVRPIANTIFFAGEALYSGKETATVEGALASGVEVIRKILSSSAENRGREPAELHPHTRKPWV